MCLTPLSDYWVFDFDGRDSVSCGNCLPDFKTYLIENLIPLFVVDVSSGWFVRSFGMNGVSYVVSIASLAGVIYLFRRLHINATRLNKGGL